MRAAMLTPSPYRSSPSTIIAEIDADAQFDAAVSPDAGVALGHRLLHRDRAADRIDDAGKLHQHAVAGGLDDAAPVLGDLRIEELMAQRLEAFERAFLVRPHQPRIPRHIGGEDRGEVAGGGHSGSPTRRNAWPSAARISGLANGAEVIEETVNCGCTSSSRCAIILASSMRPRLANAAARIQ